MKLTKTVTIGLIAVAVLALSAVFVLAQDVDDPTPPTFGPGGMMGSNGGMMGGSGGMMGGSGGMMSGSSGMMGGFGGMMGGSGGMMGGFSLLDVVAQELGLTVDELQAELANGVTIAQLAESYDVAVEDIIAAASAAHQAYLDQAVAAGWMTQEQAGWMQENMAVMIESHVNQSWGQGFGPGQGHGRGGCHGGQSGSGPASQTAPVPQGNDA